MPMLKKIEDNDNNDVMSLMTMMMRGSFLAHER